MNSFMNALYNAEGSVVTGYKNDVPFLGYITKTRVKYGSDIQVTIAYDEESMKETGYGGDIIDGSVLLAGENATYRNLHVYFE